MPISRPIYHPHAVSLRRAERAAAAAFAAFAIAGIAAAAVLPPAGKPVQAELASRGHTLCAAPSERSVVRTGGPRQHRCVR